MASSTSILGGFTGETAVAAELSARGHVVCSLPAGFPGADLIVLDKELKLRHLVQVKSDPGRAPSWKCGANVEGPHDERLIYVLVHRSLTSSTGFTFYCLPARDVAVIAKTQNDRYVERKLASNAAYVDYTMRRIDLTSLEFERHKDNFDCFQ